jgi:hypothetical protein
MYPMNSQAASRCLVFLNVTFLSLVITCGAHAQRLQWSKSLTADETRCLTELLHASHWTGAPSEEVHELITAARVSHAHLDGDGRTDYVYLFDDIGWCGSAGCALVIGEAPKHGECHLLYDGYGWYTFTVLRPRDKGYRRLYLPCEARFNGSQYQQLRAECPNVDVQR